MNAPKPDAECEDPTLEAIERAGILAEQLRTMADVLACHAEAQGERLQAGEVLIYACALRDKAQDVITATEDAERCHGRALREEVTA